VLDKVIRALFVALAVGLGWGIRGDFGHLLGAAYPGAALGLAFAFVTGQRSMLKWMPALAAVSSLGIGVGGAMSYGILHGYAKSDTLPNYAFGYFTLFCQGASWGVFGCAAIGLLLEKKQLRLAEWGRLLGSVFLGGFILYYVAVQMLDFHVNPPRSNSSIGHTGAALTLFAWLILNKKHLALRAAFFGYTGFGVGMFFGRFLGNAAYLLPFQINCWNIMEVSAGFFGGLIFTLGMLGCKFPDPPKSPSRPWWDGISVLWVLGGIPVFHLIWKITLQKKPEGWIERFAGFKDHVYENPEAWSQHVLNLLYIICAVAVVGAATWLVAHRKQTWAFRALPALFLSLIMLLFQNTSALRFWYDHQENYVNMHNVFWVLFGLMIFGAIYVYLRPPFPVRQEEEVPKLPWRAGIAGVLALYIAVLIGAGLGVNNEETMGSAVTRWPKWHFREGPFPGRENSSETFHR
jgi:hypothetical protein